MGSLTFDRMRLTGLFNTFTDQIIDHHSQKAIRPREDQRRFIQGR
jgi:hypothetical protein